MDKDRMINTVKTYIPKRLNCTKEDLQKEGVIFALNEGLASTLVSNLAVSIMEKDVVPFYCASVTNIASPAVAYRSRLMTCWVSTYRTVLDGSSVYHEIVKKLEW